MIRILSIAFSVLILLGIVGGFLWFIIRMIRRSEDPGKMAFKWALTLIIGVLFAIGVAARVGFSVGGAFVVPFVCVALGLLMSILWTPNIGAWLASPLTSLFDGGNADWQPQPMYSIAIARRKRGQFQEAAREVERQLERFPQDVVGQTLLAEIQAEDLKDLDAATVTLEQLLAQPGHAPKNLAYALHLLADWQIKLGKDPEAARESLSRIPRLLPGTEEALVAAQRIAHLAGAEEMIASQVRTPIPVRRGVENVGLLRESGSLRKADQDPAAEAARLAQHLETYPLDAEAREQLASLYASHYQRADLAIDQLQQLVDQPDQLQKGVVRWLNLIADLAIKQLKDYDRAKDALEEITTRFHGLAPAQTARQRLDHLRLEVKGAEKNQDIKLGTYEQNIGLKRRGKATGSEEPS